MKLIEILVEKAMNMATFSDTARRLGNTAKVGFEFEISVDLSSQAKKIEISKLTTLELFKKYFTLKGKNVSDDELEDRWDEINQDYWIWTGRNRNYFISSRVKELKTSKNLKHDEALEQALREWEKKRANEYKFVDWIKSEFKNPIYFIVKHNLAPKFGWVTLNLNDPIIFAEPNEKEKNMISALEKAIGTKVKVFDSYHESEKLPSEWYVEPDASITGHTGLEIVSPPLPLSKALAVMETVTQFIASHRDDFNITTNESTGLHVNVSIPGIKEKLDPIKLVLFMGEKYALGLFNRIKNEYAEEHLSELISKLRDSGKFPRDFEEMRKEAIKLISAEKYRSVNLSKLNSGYVEFRVAGGKGYERDVERLKQIVLRFVTALEIACDPSLERQEYVKKLVKVFNVALDDTAGKLITSPVPVELKRIVELNPTLQKELETVQDEGKSNEERRKSLVTVMAGMIKMIIDDSSRPFIKERAWLKWKAKQLGVKPTDVDSYFRKNRRNSYAFPSRDDFKKVYNI